MILARSIFLLLVVAKVAPNLVLVELIKNMSVNLLPNFLGKVTKRAESNVEFVVIHLGLFELAPSLLRT